MNRILRACIALAVIGLPATSLAFEDQWKSSTKSLSDYLTDGYTMSQPIALHLSPFSKTEFRYVLTKGTQLAQCTETIIRRKDAIVDKTLACSDLAPPFAR